MVVVPDDEYYIVESMKMVEDWQEIKDVLIKKEWQKAYDRLKMMRMNTDDLVGSLLSYVQDELDKLDEA